MLSLAEYVTIPFEPYQGRKKYGWTPHEPLPFRTADGQPFQLSKAYDSQRRCELQGWDTHVLARCGTKISYVLHPQGQPKYSRQKNVQFKKGSILLEKVAKQIAEVVEAYIDEVRYMDTDDDTWRFGSGHIQFEDIYLLGLQQVDKASFQPVLAVLCD